VFCHLEDDISSDVCIGFALLGREHFQILVDAEVTAIVGVIAMG